MEIILEKKPDIIFSTPATKRLRSKKHKGSKLSLASDLDRQLDPPQTAAHPLNSDRNKLNAKNHS